jgi:hypothetical protein
MTALLFFIGTILVLRMFDRWMRKKYKEDEVQPKSELNEVEEARRLQDLKVCPPHKWRHHEIKDASGNLVHWKLICDLCGPLGSQDTGKREI